MEPDGPTCKTCRWWNTSWSNSKSGEGDCVRHAPVNAQMPDQEQKSNGENHWAVWPVTFHDDFCGDHEPMKESK